MSFAFGRTGGNIEPFTITIAGNGSVTANGPVRPLRRQLGPRDLASLVNVVDAQRFFSLPRSVRCPGTLPDFASNFVTVRTRRASRTVLVHGDCSPRFEKVYRALSSAVGIR